MTPAEILQDFRRRYEQSYVFVEFPEDNPSMCGKEGLFFVERITGNTSDTGVLHLTSDEYGKIKLNLATDHTIKFMYPPIGVFQNGKQAYYMRRLPNRQYKRGLCSENCRISPVTSRIYEAGRGDGMPFETVAAAFVAHSFSFAAAMDKLNYGECRSVAMHDNFSLVAAMTAANERLLMFWDCPVAKVTPNPKQQGLKPSCCAFCDACCSASTPNPKQQGLKHGGDMTLSAFHRYSRLVLSMPRLLAIELAE